MNDQAAYGALRQVIDKAFDGYFEALGLISLDIQNDMEVALVLDAITSALWARYFEGNAMAEVIFKMGEVAGREDRPIGTRYTIPKGGTRSRKNDHGRVEFYDKRSGKVVGEQG